MARITIEGFSGIKPRLSPRLIKDDEAQIANNVRLESGELRGWNLAEQIANLSGGGAIKTIYQFGAGGGSPTWLHWPSDVDVARSPVLGDATERTYYTGDGVPKIINTALVAAVDFDKLGIIAPVNTPTIAAPALNTAGTVGGNITSTLGRLIFTSTTIFNQSGHSNDTIETTTSGTTPDQLFSFPQFITGFEVMVDTIVDADHFTIKSATGADAITTGDAFGTWQVAAFGAVPTYVATGNVIMPNGMLCSETAHGLRAGDILTMTTVDVIPQWRGYRAKLTTTSTGGLTGSFDFHARNSVPANVSFDVYGNWSYSVTRNEDLLSARAYVFTWVTDLGEESAPSPPTDVVTVLEGDAVVISGFGTPPATDQTTQYINIYRTATGTNGTAFQFVAQIAAGAFSYTDTLQDEALGAVLYTEAFDIPPSTLAGIVAVPNGFLAGFFGNVLCFSEPGYPHAWPIAYRQTVDYQIVGLAVLGQSVMILTTGTPYVTTGSHPRNMAVRRIEAQQACVSKRSIVAIGNDVLYASANGLVLATSSDLQVITEAYLTREQWQVGYAPSTIMGANYNGQYFGFFDLGGGNKHGFVFDPREARSALHTLSHWFQAHATTQASGDLYVSDGTNLLLWGNGSQTTYTWRSKVFGMPYPLNMGGARVIASGYPVTLNLRDAAAQTVIASKTIAGPEPVRLPAGKLYSQLEVEIVAATGINVELVQVSESFAELIDT